MIYATEQDFHSATLVVEKAISDGIIQDRSEHVMLLLITNSFVPLDFDLLYQDESVRAEDLNRLFNMVDMSNGTVDKTALRPLRSQLAMPTRHGLYRMYRLAYMLLDEMRCISKDMPVTMRDLDTGTEIMKPLSMVLGGVLNALKELK